MLSTLPLAALLVISQGPAQVGEQGWSPTPGLKAFYGGRFEEALAAWAPAMDKVGGLRNLGLLCAEACARLGKTGESLEWLERAAQAGLDLEFEVDSSAALPSVRAHPDYPALRATFARNRASSQAALREQALRQRLALAASESVLRSSPVKWLDGQSDGSLASYACQSRGEHVVIVAQGGAWLWHSKLAEPLARLCVLSDTLDRRVEFSPDGERVLLFDGLALSASVFDGRSGERLLTLHAADELVRDADFLDDDHVATLDETGVLRVWELSSGSPRPTAQQVPAVFVEGSPNGRFLTLDQDRVCRIWDTATGALIEALRGPDAPHSYASFLSDGRILTEDDDFRARIWTPGNARPQTSFACLPRPLSRRLTGSRDRSVHGPLLSASGDRIVALGMDDRGQAYQSLWDARTGAQIAALNPSLDHPAAAVFVRDYVLVNGPQGAVNVYAIADGREAGSFLCSSSPSLGATPGGSVLIGGMSGIFVLGGGASALSLQGHALNATSLAVDARGSIVVGCTGPAFLVEGGVGPWTPLAPPGAFEALRTWDPTTGQELEASSTAGNALWYLAGLPQGPLFAIDIYDGALAIEPGASESLRLKVRDPRSATLSRDGSHIAFACFRTSPYAELWSVEAGTWRASFPGITDQLWMMTGGIRLQSQQDLCTPAFSSDGSLLFTSQGAVIGVWDSVDGRPVESLEGHSSYVRDLECSPSEERLLSSSLDGTARLWSLASGEQTVLEGHDGPVWHGIFHPQGQMVATAARGGDNAIRLWDLAGRQLHELRGHSANVNFIGFSPDGAVLLSCSDDGSSRLWDVDTGSCRATLSGHLGAVLSGAFMDSGARVVTLGKDSTSRVWDASDGRLLVTHVEYAEGAWLSFVPSGHYVAGGAAAEWASVEVNGRRYPLSSFASVLCDPQKVQDSLAGRLVPAAPSLPSAPHLVLDSDRDGVEDQREFWVKAHIEDLYGVTQLLVTLDGAPLYQVQVSEGGVSVTQDGAPAPADLVELTRERDGRFEVVRVALRVTMPPTANEAVVRIRARNARDIASQWASQSYRYEAPPARAEDLYLLAIGVGDYADDSLDLRAPTKDVADIVERFQAEQGRLFAQVHVKTLIDDEVTSSALNRVLDEHLFEAGSEDTIVVFVAGHGARSRTGRYFFLTSDATPAEPTRGISRDQLYDLVQWNGIEARRRLLLIDTCHAGEGFKDGSRGVSVPQDAFDQDRVDEELAGSGLYIVAGSTELGAAREVAGNGIFTRALLDGLNGAADMRGDGNGIIDVDELIEFAAEAVRAQPGPQRVTKPRVVGGSTFPLGSVPR